MTDKAEIIARAVWGSILNDDYACGTMCDEPCVCTKLAGEAAIAALTSHGLAIVPVEPTGDMLHAGNENIKAQANDPEWPTDPPFASSIYKAMIGAGE